MPLILDQHRFRTDHARMRPQAHPVEADCSTELQQFRSHSLEAQVAVELANRTDSKYLLPIGIMPQLLREMITEHSVLESAGHRAFTYQNTYFDTPDWDLYRQHHNGKRNRHKCRFRRYAETDIAFLEIKFKSNKLRTVKERMPWPSDEPGNAVSAGLPVEPSLYINYRRITLWNRLTNERLTLDYDLHFRRPQQDRLVRLEDICIAELKREGKMYGSPFVRRAKSYGYKPQAVSKYCIGVCLTDDGQLKQNRFKALLNRLGRRTVTGVQIS